VRLTRTSKGTRLARNSIFAHAGLTGVFRRSNEQATGRGLVFHGRGRPNDFRPERSRRADGPGVMLELGGGGRPAPQLRGTTKKGTIPTPRRADRPAGVQRGTYAGPQVWIAEYRTDSRRRPTKRIHVDTHLRRCTCRHPPQMKLPIRQKRRLGQAEIPTFIRRHTQEITHEPHSRPRHPAAAGGGGGSSGTLWIHRTFKASLC